MALTSTVMQNAKCSRTSSLMAADCFSLISERFALERKIALLFGFKK